MLSCLVNCSISVKLTLKIILVPTKRTAQYIEQSVNHVIMLKTYVSAIKKVYGALGAAQSELLTTIREVSYNSRKPFARITAYQ
jgi:hypothetical protein